MSLHTAYGFRLADVDKSALESLISIRSLSATKGLVII